MKVLSLFSGVGGFDLGLENAGMETVFQCEWDKHATAILERHWPNIPRWGDITTLTGRHILDHAPVIDVVAWGSPCQDLSVAGKRAGLSGERSGLFHEGIRIIKEIKELTDGQYPRISIWENVYGALSSNGGADFGQVLYEMDEAGACFSEWRVLDAQYFGVPQRRRRVFLVSVFDPRIAANCPDPLLPVSEGVCWNPSQGRTARETVTGTTQKGFGNSGFQRWIETDTAITLSARDHKSSNTMVVGSLAARDYKGVGNQYVQEGKLVVEPFVKAKRAQSATDDEKWVEAEVNPTINQFDTGDVRTTTVVVGSLQARDYKGTNHEGARDGKLVVEPIGFSHTQGLSAQPSETAWPTLRTEGAGMAVAIPIQDGREMEKHQNGLGVASEGEPSYTLDQTGAQAVAYSIREDAKANTFSATELDRANALNSLRPSPQSHHAQMFITEPTMSVRRLTPLECERLMGWPDNWTAGQADTHRYKQCGNGVASPVAQWIGEQIMEVTR